MQRRTITEGFRRLVDDLDRTGVVKALDQAYEGFRKEGVKANIKVPLEPFKRFALLFESYDQPTREIARIFEVDVIADTSIWEALVSEAARDAVLELRMRLRPLHNQAPKILALLSRDYELGPVSKESKQPTEKLLTVTLVENENQESSPSRLVHLLEGVSDLYSGFATLGGAADNDLKVVGCDSGSDKSFDFLGAAEIIKQVRIFIVQLFDRVVFYRQTRMQVGLDLISQSLPIMDEIENLKNKGTITPEAAEIAKRKIFSGATKFVESGAITDDMNAAASHSPRLLMRPETRLLAAPTGQTSGPPQVAQSVDSEQGEERLDETEGESLSEDDIRRLRKLLDKEPKPQPNQSRPRRK